MFRAIATLKKPNDFKKIFDEGKKLHEKNLSIFYAAASELKIGMAVSRKHGNAVARNRTKRLIREFFRLNQKKIKAAHIVIVSRKPLLDSYYETASIMLKLLRKAGLIK